MDKYQTERYNQRKEKFQEKIEKAEEKAQRYYEKSPEKTSIKFGRIVDETGKEKVRTGFYTEKRKRRFNEKSIKDKAITSAYHSQTEKIKSEVKEAIDEDGQEVSKMYANALHGVYKYRVKQDIKNLTINRGQYLRNRSKANEKISKSNLEIDDKYYKKYDGTKKFNLKKIGSKSKNIVKKRIKRKQIEKKYEVNKSNIFVAGIRGVLDPLNPLYRYRRQINTAINIAKFVWSIITFIWNLIMAIINSILSFSFMGIILLIIILFFSAFAIFYTDENVYTETNEIVAVHEKLLNEMYEDYINAANGLPFKDAWQDYDEIVIENNPKIDYDNNKLASLVYAYLGEGFTPSKAKTQMEIWFREMYEIEQRYENKKSCITYTSNGTQTEKCQVHTILYLKWNLKKSLDDLTKEVLGSIESSEDRTLALQRYDLYIEEYGANQILGNPLGNNKTAITSPYGCRVLRGQLDCTHNGIDLKADERTGLYAVGDGVVTKAGEVNTGGGNCVNIYYKVEGDGYTVRYCHMSSISVSEGETVKNGQLVGYAGSSGNVTGAHLHLEVWLGKNNVYNPKYRINPLHILQIEL